MNFLIDSRYQYTEPISDDAWKELICVRKLIDHTSYKSIVIVFFLKELIQDNKELMEKFLVKIIEYRNDIKTASEFIEYFKFDINEFKPKTKDIYLQKLASYQTNQNATSINKVVEERYYFPSALSEENICYVGDEAKFIEMLTYFEEAKPDVIGMDCEWKPEFNNLSPIGQEPESESVTQKSEKSNRPDTFQIATRERVFIIESRDLVDSLSEQSVDKFGELVLFCQDLKKLGNSSIEQC